MKNKVKYKFKNIDAKLSFQGLVWYMAYWFDTQDTNFDKMNLDTTLFCDYEVEIEIEAGKFEIEKFKPLYFPRFIIDTFFEVLND